MAKCKHCTSCVEHPKVSFLAPRLVSPCADAIDIIIILHYFFLNKCSGGIPDCGAIPPVMAKWIILDTEQFQFCSMACQSQFTQGRNTQPQYSNTTTVSQIDFPTNFPTTPPNSNSEIASYSTTCIIPILSSWTRTPSHLPFQYPPKWHALHMMYQQYKWLQHSTIQQGCRQVRKGDVVNVYANTLPPKYNVQQYY